MRLHLPWRGNSGHKTADEESRGLRESELAERYARGKMEEAQHRGPEVGRVVRRLKEFQQVNHVGERVVKALQEGYGRSEGEPHGS